MHIIILVSDVESFVRTTQSQLFVQILDLIVQFVTHFQRLLEAPVAEVTVCFVLIEEILAVIVIHLLFDNFDVSEQVYVLMVDETFR